VDVNGRIVIWPGFSLMPFGNSVSTSSHECEVQGAFSGLCLQEAGPGFHGLSHGAWTTARSPLGGDRAAHLGVHTAQKRLHLTRGDHVVELAQREPRCAYP